MLKPPPRQKLEYEKVPTHDWVIGVIQEIQRDEKRDTGFKDEETGESLIRDMIRFKFNIEGCNYPHYSRWMSFSYHEKANLFKKYVTALVDGAKPDMDFDLDRFKGFKIKMMWSDDRDYQNVDLVRPFDNKIDPTIAF